MLAAPNHGTGGGLEGGIALLDRARDSMRTLIGGESRRLNANTPLPAIDAESVAGAFAGYWHAHSAWLVVDPAGPGILSWRAYAWCQESPPPCDVILDSAIHNGGHASIVLTATGPTTATGEVLTTSIPEAVPLGRFTARLDPANDLLDVPFPLFDDRDLCGPDAPTSACGA